MKRTAVLLLSLMLMTVPSLSACRTWPGSPLTLPSPTPTSLDTTIEPTPTPEAPVDYDDLIEKLREMAANPALQTYPMYAGIPEMAMEKDSGSAMPGSQVTSPTVNPDHSQTNIQVAGVDEADLVKTDGRYLYVVANNRLTIIDAQDPVRMKMVSSLAFATNRETDTGYLNESILEIFLDPDQARLVVLLSGYSYDKVPQTYEAPAPETIRPDAKIAMPEWIAPGRTYTTTLVYDIRDRARPNLVRSFSQEGSYITSRKIGSVVTVVTNQYKFWIWPMFNENSKSEPTPQQIFPATSTDLTNDQAWTTVSPNQLTVLPEGDPGSQIVLASIDSVKDDQKPEILSVIGATGSVYCSLENLYLFGMRTVWTTGIQERDQVSGENWPRSYEYRTEIYRFSLIDGRITANGKGSVPGTILSQYSLDEYQGYLRLATTTGQAWSGSNDPSHNHVFVLDQDLSQVGEVTGLAEGETIRSVRFIGPLGYVVTFRTTDPLFVIDLHDPKRPKVTGELKIPGYSAYLHPLSEDRLIGVGYDVGLDGEIAYERGLKVSLFDIADRSRPAELSTLILGSRGSYSELSSNPRSMLFSQDKNLIAFPAMLTETMTDSRLEYGQPKFQGLVVLTIANDQLVLRGGITHVDINDPSFELDPYTIFYGQDAIHRGVYIGNILFTISNRQVIASGLDTLARIGAMELPGT